MFQVWCFYTLMSSTGLALGCVDFTGCFESIIILSSWIDGRLVGSFTPYITLVMVIRFDAASLALLCLKTDAEASFNASINRLWMRHIKYYLILSNIFASHSLVFSCTLSSLTLVSIASFPCFIFSLSLSLFLSLSHSLSLSLSLSRSLLI